MHIERKEDQRILKFNTIEEEVRPIFFISDCNADGTTEMKNIGRNIEDLSDRRVDRQKSLNYVNPLEMRTKSISNQKGSPSTKHGAREIYKRYMKETNYMQYARTSC